MKNPSENAPTAQDACHVKEWLAVLDDAARHGLIGPPEAAAIAAKIAMGLLPPGAAQRQAADLLRAGPAAGMALNAIAPTFAPGDVIELRALNPAGGGGLSFCGRLNNPAERAKLEAFIGEHIGQRNLYVGCNPRRADMAGTAQPASAADVPMRRNVVLDFDRKDAPDADPDWTRTVGALRTELDPLLILDSGNGFHVWLPVEPLSGPDVGASAGPLAVTMARIGADNIADPPRIVRLPFTVNLPNAAKRARGATVRLAHKC